jgi:vacuolar-type H+-ATPase subunit H
MNKPNPYKAQEIEILTAAIAQLGDNSYLGPWLKEILPELKARIESDIYPTITLAQAQAQALSIVTSASAEAAKIRVDAEKDVEAQYKRLSQARSELSSTLFAISRGAERLANSVSVA